MANNTMKVVQGGAWIYGKTVFTSLVNLAVIAILARQLSPADFGVVALALVLLQLLTILATEGVNQFVIHDHKDGHEERSDAAFWLDLTMSSGCALLGIACIPLITALFPDDRLGKVLFVMLVAFPLGSVAKVPEALLKKAFAFRSLEIRDAAIALMTGGLAVAMALMGWGVWSLVIPGIVGAVLKILAVFAISPWRPSRHVHFKLWPRVFRYYANIIGAAITSFIVTNGDTLVVGRVMGVGILGVYNLAWQSAHMANRAIVITANKLVLPTFAAISNDLNQMRSVLYRILRLLSGIAFPLIVGLFVLADYFVLIVYGNQWEGAITPLRILLVYALRYTLGPPIGAFFQAIGRPDVNFKLGVIGVPFYLAGIIIGSDYGLIGVATGVTIVRTAFGLLTFEVTARFLRVPFREILRPVVPALCAASMMGMTVYLMEQYVGSWFPERHLLELLALVGFGALVYLWLARWGFPQIWREIALVARPLAGSIKPIVGRLAAGRPHARTIADKRPRPL